MSGESRKTVTATRVSREDAAVKARRDPPGVDDLRTDAAKRATATRAALCGPRG